MVDQDLHEVQAADEPPLVSRFRGARPRRRWRNGAGRPPGAFRKLGEEETLIAGWLRDRQLRIRLETPVAADVFHGDSPLVQYPADQQMAVALRRILFAAHHRHARPGDLLPQPFDPGPEER